MARSDWSHENHHGSQATANVMRNIFARYGLQKQIVSDNSPPFQSAEYKEFLRQNGIQRVLVSPYHPSSNGLAERFVQTLGSWGGAVVRALASHQCVPGSIPGPGVICGLSLLLVLALAARVFLRVLWFSSLLKNQHF